MGAALTRSSCGSGTSLRSSRRVAASSAAGTCSSQGGRTAITQIAADELGADIAWVAARVNHDFAGYHIAAHADVGAIEAHWIEESDDQLNLLGVKGLGEIGIVGAAAAIANAV
jgi:hypothetical protein